MNLTMDLYGDCLQVSDELGLLLLDSSTTSLIFIPCYGNYFVHLNDSDILSISNIVINGTHTITIGDMNYVKIFNNDNLGYDQNT